MGCMVRTPKPFVDREREEAEEFRERRESRRIGKHKIKKLQKIAIPKRPTKVHLVIGDSHAHWEEGNQRFEALGRMVKAIRPDCVIDLGDSADMSSLLGIESGSKGPIFEGFSYWKDIDVYTDAKERYHHYLKGTNKYPRHIRLMGNHEDRITRLLELEPRFRGIIDLDDLGDSDFGRDGWEVYPFLEAANVDGVVYSHYFKSPGGRRPVSGVVPTRSVLMKYPGSFTRVFGHTHSFGFFEDADGAPGDHFKKISSINAGCFFSPKMSGMRWSGTDKNRWRSGILVLEVESGDFSGTLGQLKSWKWFDYWDVMSEWG